MAPMIAVQAAELSVADLLRAYQKAVVPVMAQCDGDCTYMYIHNKSSRTGFAVLTLKKLKIYTYILYDTHQHSHMHLYL